MDYMIREMRKEEYCLLEDFLYEAIYVPDGVEPPDKTIIHCPALQEYILDFGKRKDDKAFVAEIQGNVAGAAWVRIMNDYGHMDDDTPSLAISVHKGYRGLGIGTSLLKRLLAAEKSAGYARVSLSVQKSNRAVKLYADVGFSVVGESDEEYMMAVNL
ncbi:MAG TPA: GNAT family N-acetyltransferase [Candidatus Gemmiger avium]|nr:GNAT family N-acetyltransferase [Candidatus Gemmiger avium]